MNNKLTKQKNKRYSPKSAIHKVHKSVKPHVQRAHGFYKDRKLSHKVIIWTLVILIFLTSTAYGIAYWYQQKHSNEPLTMGVTFIPRYASYFGLNPEEVMDDTINELGVKRFRFVTYWNEYEPQPGQYDFSELDWLFDKVEKANGEISLAIGLRQPRWPECHIPEWAANLPQEQWYPKLKDYMGQIIDRYKDREVLKSYQLENEYFLKVFGVCSDHSRDRLVDEFNFVKQKDPTRPIIVSRSNNATPSWPVGKPRADIVGAAIYKRVWDRTITKRYFEYPYPPWFYAFLAGGTELTTGKNTIIHELQAEPWLPDGVDLATSTIEEQDKSMNSKLLKERFKYAKDTGIKTIDLWGIEWWYWRKVKFNDSSLWDVAKDEFQYKQTGFYQPY